MTLSDRIFNATTANGCRELTEERFRQAMKEIAWEAWKESGWVQILELDTDTGKQAFEKWFNKQVV